MNNDNEELISLAKDLGMQELSRLQMYRQM